jgi:hypothetical protein
MAVLCLIPRLHPQYPLFVVWRWNLFAVAILPSCRPSSLLRRGRLLPEPVGRQRVAGRKWHHGCEPNPLHPSRVRHGSDTVPQGARPGWRGKSGWCRWTDGNARRGVCKGNLSPIGLVGVVCLLQKRQNALFGRPAWPSIWLGLSPHLPEQYQRRGRRAAQGLFTRLSWP